MTAEHVWRELIVQDALDGRSQFHGLVPDLQLELQAGVTELVDQLEDACNRRWNSVSFTSINEILIDGEPYIGHVRLATSLREKVKEAGVNGKSASGIVSGSFRDTIFMIQAEVDTLDQLRSTRAIFRIESAGFRGRELHTKSETPPTQIRTTLHRS